MKTVMIAIEGRDEAVRLTAVAAALASQGAEVDVVHVLEPGSERGLVEAERRVHAAVDLARCHGLMASGHVVTGESGVARRLVEEAHRLRADVVVIGSRGLGRVRAIGEHSVSHAVLADLAIPVLVLPDCARLPLRGFRRALAAVGSETDAAAVAAAVGLLPGVAEVLVAHLPRRVALHVGAGGAGTFAEIGETSAAVLTEAVARFTAAGLPVTARTLERAAGGVAGSIVDAAGAWAADVVVMGARRPRDWEALVAGSTTYEVLHRCDRPVLVAARR